MLKLLFALAFAGVLTLATPAAAGTCGERLDDAAVAEKARELGHGEPVRVAGEELARYRDGLKELAGRDLLETATVYLWIIPTDQGMVIVVEMDEGGCVVAAFGIPDAAHRALRFTPAV